MADEIVSNAPPGQRCQNCLYWQQGQGTSSGMCRRNAPQAFYDDKKRENLRLYWPVSLSSDWCGAWATAAAVV